MNNKLKFLRGTADEYTAAEKDSDTIYFTTDDNKLYIGDKKISGDGSVDVDSELSDTSENPVQNKVINAALNEKASKAKYGDETINVGRKADTTVGNYSTAEGYFNTASGEYSHAEGILNTASGYASHAEGYSNIASGIHSHAEGESTEANEYNSHAEGHGTIASNYNSHAEGESTTASGQQSHAEGRNTTASGGESHAEGYNTTASGYSSHSGGNSSESKGDYSFAHGRIVTANNDNEVAFGIYNVSNSDTLFSIGDGTDSENRHNAFEITTDGGKLHDKNIATPESTIITLSTTDWSSNSQTVSASIVTANNIVITVPSPDSQDTYSSCGVKCTSQEDGSLIFICDSVPNIDININIVTL